MDEATWLRLFELMRSMQNDMVPSLVRIHEGDDLSLLEGAMLRVLDRGEPPTVKELAELIGRSESRMSRIVDRMVRHGLVARYEDERDRRQRRIRLTTQGSELLRRIDELRLAGQRDLWRQFTEDERAVAMHAMELFAKAARRIKDERDQAR